MRQSKIDTAGEERIRDGILAAAILTRNASRKDARRKTSKMEVVVVSLQLLISSMRPGFLVITVSDSGKMKRGVMRRFLWLFVCFTRDLFLATHQTANATYGGFDDHKHDNHG
jgi:hypothetical protein